MIYRMNEFRANPGSGDALKRVLAEVIPDIQGSDGCISAVLLEDGSDDNRLVVIEQWTTEDAHKAAVAAIPGERLRAAMQLVSEPPQGRYLRAARDT